VAGKTFWFISPAQAVPVVAEAGAGFTQAAQAMGVNAKVFDGQGSVTQWNAGIQEAVTQHAAAIILYAENPSLLASSLAQAQAAHIPVVSLANQEPGTPLQAGVNGALSPDPNLGGTWEAAYALKESNCQGTLGFLYSSTFATEALQLPAFQSTVHKYCPSCQVVTENIPSSASQSASATIATTTANRYPDMKVMVSAAAANTDVMVPALKALGWKGELIDWSGSSQNVGYIKSGNIESSDVLWPPEGELAFAALDMAARLAAHQPAVSESTPLQLVTIGNISNATALDNYAPLYTALWTRGE
jgi:ribose transport system substrate-binding protein